MRKFTQLVISLPLLVTPLALMGAKQVNAATENVGPVGAVQLLAQSRSVDAKCHHLSSKEHSELNDYVAKAEIAAAAMTSVEDAQNARRAGHAHGKSMACGQQSNDLVLATMDAARRAMAAAVSQRKKKKTVKYQPKPETRTNGLAKASNLTAYRRVTEAYYLERRCQHLSRRDAVRFWKKVVSRHNAVLKKYGTSQVAKAKNGAKNAAGKWGRCGSRTAKIVAAGYRG